MERLIKGGAWLLAGIVALVAAFLVVWYLGSFAGLVFFLWSVALAVFAFRRSYKAFVEYWRGRISSRVEIEISIDKSAYVAGDPVNVAVSIRGKEELEIQEGRVDLLYANRYIYRSRRSSGGASGGGSHYTTREVTEENAVATERLLEEGRILPGSYAGREVAFEVPPSAPPSAEGEITDVAWKVRVTLGISGAPDVLKEVPVTVFSASESYTSWAETAPELDTSGVCDMEFRLTGRSFRVGERIEGILVVTPRQDFESRTLRVDLLRREIVPRNSGNMRETVPASVVVEEKPRFQTGMSREYAFAVDVPEGAGPNLKTKETYVGWWLRASVDRKMALDYELKQLLNVYNGPVSGRCGNCSAKVLPGASYCTNCGEPVVREETPVPRAAHEESSTTGVLTETPDLSAAPPVPPSGPTRAQRGFTLGIFGVVGGFILLTFLAVGGVFLLVFLFLLLGA